MDNATTWKIINKYFEDNPQSLVRHHVESYNDFFKHGIFQIFKEKNPVRIQTRFDEDINDYRSQCILYFGGKNGDKIYFGKPVIYDDDNAHYMYPNEARLRNMTYGITIHYDVEVEFIDILSEGENPNIVGVDESAIEFKDNEELTSGGQPRNKRRAKFEDIMLTPLEAAFAKEETEKTMVQPNVQRRTITLEKMFLGRFPIMMQSDHCILSGLPKEVRHTMGECLNDVGGYFIIDGKEKTVVSQEKFGDNMLYVRDVNNDETLYSAEMRSVSENVSKPIRTLSVRLVAPTSTHTNKNIVVAIPNVRKPVPLFIVFRALGIISDKQIITMCLLDMEKYESMVDLFIPSVHDAGGVLTQQIALKYIATLTKGKTTAHALEILADYFLPHVGEMNFIQKAYTLGNIVFRLLSVYAGMEPLTDRDNFKYKRIELVGTLMYDLFREYYGIQQHQIQLGFEEKVNYNKNLYEDNLYGLIQQTYKDVFRDRSVEAGFKKAFKGNWGAHSHTKRIGIVQDLNRLSHNAMMSHLRKTNLPLDASVKVVGPRVLHNTQWGFFDPIDTPDGGNIGLHKHMSISTYISQSYSREHLLAWLREKVSMKLLEECSPQILSTLTKVFVNGYWAGAVSEPFQTIDKLKLFRRNGLIPIYTSVSFDYRQNAIYIYTDGGRICRPVFYKDSETNKMSVDNKSILKKIEDGDFTWNELIAGFNKKKVADFHPNQNKMYELYELYENIDVESNPAKLKRFIEEKAVIDYIDTNESESSLIAMNADALLKDTHNHHTHLEIHESLIFGMLSNMINFPENNPATRNSFSCGQSKQACSMYHTNFQVRMDKTAVVLNSGQNPLVKSRYLEHINNEGNPYGENAIVAVMCYTGYNVEDAILVNEGALKRGMFQTTYYSTYETHEEKSKTADGTYEKLFTNIESDSTVVGLKPGYDYSALDEYGLIRENTPLTDKTVVIGLSTSSSTMPGRKIDASKMPKKGQLGVVDKTFITEGDEGTRIAKVRVREIRVPTLGDKMGSRAGQKGTVGLVIPEPDMPFTKDGIRPDLIINPHAIPSRMTIGQFVETITGKACAIYGGYGDCTAFNNNGSKIGVFGDLLTKSGYHSSGNEILYNGMTGEQLEVEVFMGPTYYMRLKHMVKDKINYRARGPNTALTRQPVSGRANDGGLRIGEMERDVLISHGISEFLRESMMDRGDKYQMAVCNTTGMMAIYNPAKNLFISPMADGPIQFTDAVDGTDMRINPITKYGRNFSIVEVPYSLKLLIQELQAINVQMRIITEDNIDQLENMTKSTNITKLSFGAISSSRQLVNAIQKTLSKPDKTNIFTPAKEVELESPVYDPSSPTIQVSHIADLLHSDTSSGMVSPPYAPSYDTESPVYNPDSPYIGSPYTKEDLERNADMISPPYAPDTPTNDENDNQTEYTIGENVHYRGDFLPTRIWRVKNISDNFITIETDTLDGLDQSDAIKVISPIDIYRPGDFTYTTPTVIHEQMEQPVESTGKIQKTNDSATIHFAPVINISNNGNDASVPSSVDIDGARTPDYPPPSHTPEYPPPSPSGIPQIKMKETLNKETEPPAPDLFSGGLMIKKIG
jgi:DNA-directed RNA polymerase II subunit RPB2